MVKSAKPRGIFIDLDGTLAESLAVLRQAYDCFLSEAGKTGDAEEFASLNGPTLAEIVARLRERHALAGEAPELLARYQAIIDDAYLDTPPVKHSLDFVRRARRAGWRVTVVTSNTATRAQSWLRHHGFADLVDDVVSGEQVLRGKPAPDLYRLAVAQAEADLASSFAVEDSPQGACAAVTAGLRTFVCTAGIDPDLERAWPAGIEFVASLDQLIPLLRK